MKEFRKKDIRKIRKLLKDGNSEQYLEIKDTYIEIYGYVSMDSIIAILKEGFRVYHSKLNDSALVVCRL